MQTAVITGSSKGIGFGLAREFRTRGWNVVVSGRGQDSVDDAVRRLEEGSGAGKVLGLVCDVSDAAAVQALWDRAAADFGRVDVWVNNAGVARTVHTVAELSPDWIREMVTSNLLGTILGSRTALLGMTAQGGGKIVNILGGGSDGKIRPGMTVYGATKRGLDGFTTAFAKELEGGPVILMGVSPGMVVTEGVVREAHELGAEGMAKNRKAMNILSDHVEEAAPEIVEFIVSTSKNGARLRRMTTMSVMRRFASGGRKRGDTLGRYGI